MFPAEVYVTRRKRLRTQVQSGLILFLGNSQSPMNCRDNQYPFRQDSSFLYFFGLDLPDLAAVIDVDEGAEHIFGDDPAADDVIWTGPQPPLCQTCEKAGISQTLPLERLQTVVAKAAQQGRNIRYLPQYRPENILKMAGLLKTAPALVNDGTCEQLIRAVVAQRSIKDKDEIEQIEAALDVSFQMHTLAMKLSKPGAYEREIAGAIEGLALSKGCRLAFPAIFSIHGETLHNPHHENLMKVGDIAVNDSGAESPLRYASDITRTIPVGGRFSQRQKEIYAIVLNAQETAIDAVKPGVEFRDIHRLASRMLLSGLKNLGLVKGDPEQGVEAGAHTLFFQCGVGHMMGLDVHDMEAIGEDYVGYTDAIRRNPAFGFKSLRLGKAVEPGFVVTVEPGIYFIPELIDRWKARQECSEYINYDMVEKYRDFGGVRVEDDILVTADGNRLLGAEIPKTVDQVERMSSD